MKKIGLFVGDNGDWKFFREISEDLGSHYETRAFEQRVFDRLPLLSGRLNRWAFEHGIRSLLRQSDLGFFEWASELLVEASHMEKYCPIVTRLHSYELFVWAPKIDWDNVDGVILISEAMKRRFSQLYPSQAHKAEVVYNAIPLDRFKPARREFRMDLGMLCSIHPVKRIYEVVLAVKEIKNNGYDPHLHIAGEPHELGYSDDYHASIVRLIEKLDLADSVTLHGYVEDTPNWLHNIDIFISNSYWEGQQVALIEAMATGCYCLSHFWDGAEEVLPPQNLYVTGDQLVDKIIEYSNQPLAVRQEHRAAMRAIACEKFDTEKQKIAIRKVIANVL